MDESPGALASLTDWYDADAWETDPQNFGPNARLIRNVGPPETEVWFRSPQFYVHVIKETPYNKFVFTTREISHRRVFPAEFFYKFLPAGYRREWMIIGRQYATRWDSHQMHDPEYRPERLPVWAYGDPPEQLLRFCDSYERNQWSRVIIAFLPRRSEITELNRVLEWIYRVNAAYPHVRMHYAYGSNFRRMFGLNFHSADFNPGSLAQFKQIHLPNGKPIIINNARDNLKWIHVLGFSVSDLQTYEGRIAFNCASALWAANNWNKPRGLAKVVGRTRIDPYGLLVRPDARVLRRVPRNRRRVLTPMFEAPPFDADAFPQLSSDPTEPYHLARPLTSCDPVPVSPRTKDAGDKILCNRCSLAPTCKSYREGAICTLPTSSMGSLATMFGTTDAETIRGALQAVLARQADRYERSARAFRDDEESDVYDLKRSKHLMDMESSLLRSTEALVKLIDPKYRESVTPAVSNTTMHVYNPNVLVADVVRELQARNVDISQVDPKAILDALPADIVEN